MLFSVLLDCFAPAQPFEEDDNNNNNIERIPAAQEEEEEESTEDFEQGVHITVQEEEEENIEDLEQGVRIEEEDFEQGVRIEEGGGGGGGGGGGEESTEDFEQGVHITVQRLAGGSRQVKRIKFSRQVFSEMQARLWWEENGVRVREHYASASPSTSGN
ncbi:hypothetical protein SUGI_0179630 [Cryptomeria japonica]|nr:hypothetical protein SUGI_0179630 [Cryptomeria japonica]